VPIVQLVFIMTYNEHYDNDTVALQTDAIETGTPKTGLIAALVAAIKARIPAGYEDEDGFHTEAKPRVHD
jgi:hypothetical protein